MEITFLGTASAVPTEKRNHSAILVSFNNENILIDCGENAQQQFRKAKLNPCKLTRILITHWHADHVLGLPGLLQTLEMSGYSKTLQIYGPKGTKENMTSIERLFGKIRINMQVHEISGQFLNEKDFQIHAEQMPHGIITNAYSIILKDKRRLYKEKLKKLKIPNSPLLKKLQEGKDIIFNKKKIKSSQVSYLEKGKKITIILDTSFSNKAISLAKNSDILISEASFLANSPNGEKLAKEYKHLTAKQAATIAKKAKVKKLILTHISQRYSKNPELLLKEAREIFKSTILPNDLDKISQ
ncbi:ribonuclease Z [Candidatus Pacearchaeota archaeon CG1_02_32_132]|nr:MAG: ribonuclease Z [Candidatus Pacearchaeota archaeon CG1_02_32_132]